MISFRRVISTLLFPILFPLGSMVVLAAGKDERTLKVSGIPSLIVRNISGNIEIRGAKQAEVKISAVKSSEDVEMDVEQVGDKIRIETKHRGRGFSRFASHGSIDYFISMPTEGNVEGHNVSGNISVWNVQGDLIIETVSGDLDLRSLGKRLGAKTVSGDIVLSQGQVDVELSTVSGDLSVTDVVGRVTGTSVSGSLRVHRTKAARMNLSTTSGNIELDGPLLKSGSYSLNTHSGAISLYLPRDSSFELSARTFSGELDSDLPLKLITPAVGQRRSRSVRATYGSGEATLDVQSFSGNIRIVKR